jgi:tRNA pseudouridine38-40 synthase
MRIKITIEYDGTRFSGWQKQNEAKSVQETIENAIGRIFDNKERVVLHGAGRTDAGVHAWGQVAHFDITSEVIIERWQHNESKLMKAINFYLIGDGIVILDAISVTHSFHARFSAKMRHYEYLILNRKAPSRILENRVWHVFRSLNVEKMTEASEYFIGKYDLNSFRSARCSARNSIRNISSVIVSRDRELITISVSAKSFLHNQVRIMVGTLKMVGEEKFYPNVVKNLLENPNRCNAGVTAPACGLYLKSIDYGVDSIQN